MDQKTSYQALFALMIIVLSLSFVSSRIQTEITVDFLEGSGVGRFQEFGFYSLYHGDIVRTPVASSANLRNLDGYRTYVVDGEFSLDKMYVKANVDGVENYWHTMIRHNADGHDHFNTNGVFYWWDNAVCYECSCDFDDFGFKLIDVKSYYASSQCDDSYDNDYDGLIDEDDPGCWNDPLNANTYNPNLDDEARYDISCSSDFDCGSGVFLEDFCQGDDVYSLYSVNRCEKPGTGLSFCANSVKSDFFKNCKFGCLDGYCKDYVDNEGPQVDLVSPIDGSDSFGDIDFEYIPSDESGIKKCFLNIDGNRVKSSNNVVNNVVNLFDFSLSNDDFHVAFVGCYDLHDNYGESNKVNFVYDFLECSYDYDCGREKVDYFCEGDTVVRESFSPICEESACVSEHTIEDVKECNSGCLNGRCKSGKSSKNDDCEGGVCEPVIINQFNTFKDINKSNEVTYLSDSSNDVKSEVSEDYSDSFWMILISLIFAILVLILLILFVLFRK